MTCPICSKEVKYVEYHFKSKHPSYRPVTMMDPYTKRLRIWFEQK